MIEKAVHMDGSVVWVLVELGIDSEEVLAEALRQWRDLLPKEEFRGRVDTWTN